MIPEERRARSHAMLLRLGGVAPDDLLTRCRSWVAAGRDTDVARAVAFAAKTMGVPLADDDYEHVEGLLRDAALDTSDLDLIGAADPDWVPPFGFAPTSADAIAGMGGETDEYGLVYANAEAEPEDDVCKAAIVATNREAGIIGLWRAWRFPADGSPWPSTRRVYLVEAQKDTDLWSLTATMQQMLADAGEVWPQLEVYHVGSDLPAYQRRARAAGALLWARDPDPGVRIAQVLHEIDFERGPLMAGDHSRVDDEGERLRLVAYLAQGAPLLRTEERIDDVLDPAGSAEVPASILTDGHWIWSDAVTYYLDRHHISPDPDLVAHIRTRGYQPAEVDGVAIYRAFAHIRELDDEADD